MRMSNLNFSMSVSNYLPPLSCSGDVLNNDNLKTLSNQLVSYDRIAIGQQLYLNLSYYFKKILKKNLKATITGNQQILSLERSLSLTFCVSCQIFFYVIQKEYMRKKNKNNRRPTLLSANYVSDKESFSSRLCRPVLLTSARFRISACFMD